MAAAARGAKSAGGTTIGILPTETRESANEWIDHVVVTGIGHARNLAVVGSGDAVIAVGGRYGTLAEIGLALTLGRPVVVLEPGWQVEGTQRAQTRPRRVELALAAVRGLARGRRVPVAEAARLLAGCRRPPSSTTPASDCGTCRRTRPGSDRRGRP